MKKKKEKQLLLEDKKREDKSDNLNSILDIINKKVNELESN